MNIQFVRDCLDMIERYPNTEEAMVEFIRQDLYAIDTRYRVYTHHLGTVYPDEIKIGVEQGKIPMIKKLRERLGANSLMNAKILCEDCFAERGLYFKGHSA